MTAAALTRDRNKCPIYEIGRSAEFNAQNIRFFLKQIAHLYPEFDSWLNFTFVRQLDEGCRKVLLAKDNGKILGASLLKITKAENKICTFFITGECRDKGLGKILMKRSLARFDGNVDITVCDERHNELAEFLSSYKFKKMACIPDFYRKGHTEYFYTRQS